MNKLRLLLALGVLSVIIYSCDNVDPFDVEDVDFGDPEIGVPLVNSTFFIADLGADPDNNTEVLSDQEGRVTLRYSDQIPPITVGDIFPAERDITLSVLSNAHTFTIPFYNIDIRTGVFKDTRMSLELTNPTDETLSVTVAIDEIIDTGNNRSYSQSFILQPNERLVSAELDLSGWTVNTPDGNLELSYSAFTNSSSFVNISDFEIHFPRLEFASLEGVFGNAILPTTEDLIDISFFDSWVSGGLDLSDPSLSFDINNSIGIPAELKLNYANITNIDGETFQLEYDDLNQGIAFNYPDISQVGDSVATRIEIDGTNSNVIDLFNKKPSMIDYDLDLSITSGPNPTTGFYTEDSRIAIDASVELPLLMRANDLILQDTIGFEEVEFDQIEGTGELLLSLVNGFPIGVGVNLYFLDEQGQTLFTLVEADDWISVDANIQPLLDLADLESQIYSIPISEEDIALIPSVSKVLTRVLITTTADFEDEFVWVYDHQGIDIKLGAILR